MSTSVNEVRHNCCLAAGDRHTRDDAGQRTGLSGLVRRLRRSLAAAQRRRKTIIELSELDDRQLDDIGIRREDIPRIVREMVDGSTGRGL